MRADRLLSILLSLQVHRRVTARELAQRLEVSERTIHRDMVALSTSGVPVVAARGTGGGWELLAEYRTNLTGLNESEIQALFLGNPATVLQDLGLHQASEGALIKLLAALPVVYRQDAEYARQRIHIDPTGWRQTEESCPQLPLLQEAIWCERKIRFSYGRDDAALVERIADPLGLVAKGSVWYFVAAIEGQPRTYRVSRIAQTTLLADEVSQRPPDFDLAVYWASSSASFRANLPRYVVKLCVPMDAMDTIYHAGRLFRIELIEPCEDGLHNIVTMCFDIPEEASACVLSFADRVEIVEPAELRERVLALAMRIVASHEERRHTIPPSHVSSIVPCIMEATNVLQS